MEATHEITGCYFPAKGEVDLTWKDLDSGKFAGITAKVTADEGNAIADVVWPCVYSGACVPTTHNFEIGLPKARGQYLVRWWREGGIFFTRQEVLTWDGEKFCHPSSDQRYRSTDGELCTHLGPLEPQMPLSTRVSKHFAEAREADNQIEM